MAFIRSYHYDEDLGVTACSLNRPDEFSGVGCAPHNGKPDTTVVMLVEHGNKTFIDLSADELDTFIAELQRARWGCFVGEWPRPVVNYSGTFDATDAFEEWLNENLVDGTTPICEPMPDPQPEPEEVTTAAQMIEWLGTFDPNSKVSFRSLIDVAKPQEAA